MNIDKLDNIEKRLDDIDDLNLTSFDLRHK